MSSVNSKVISYLKENPSIGENLSIVNFSKLSRKIIKETSLVEKDFDAILVALRRLSYKKKKVIGQDVKKILKDSSVDIKNKMIVCIAEKDIITLAELQKSIRKKGGIVHTVEGSSSITLITSEEFHDEIRKHMKSKIIKITKNLVEIIIKSPSTLEDVPGFTGYLYSLFASERINILETISCWEDTIIVIRREDLQKVMDILKV